MRQDRPSGTRGQPVLIALGGNLSGPFGDPAAALGRAVAALGRLPGLRLQAVSRLWRTPPDGSPPGTPDFLNAVAHLCGSVDPAALLGWLAALERAAGRGPAPRNAARPLDLDVIDVAGLVRDAPDPVLPHPRAHLRRFVLLPLLEVMPDWVHPTLGMTGATLLAALAPDGASPFG